MKTAIAISGFIVGLLILLAAFSSSPALPTLTSPHMIVQGINGSAYESTNWSGYAVTASAGSVTSAVGSWTVPAVTGQTTGYAACWVGIDGFSSSTVEQTGTLSYTSGGKAYYDAWYEFYPAGMVELSGAVKPGDIVSATVTCTSTTASTFTVSIIDQTQGWTYTSPTPVTVSGAKESSAEWIVEAPSSTFGVLPLANFGTADLGFDSTGVSGTCYATVTGVGSEPIGSFPSASIQTITMVSSRGATEATPSSLSSDRTSFTVTEPNSSPTPTPTPTVTPKSTATPTPPPHHHR
jgi:hypothetical protein